MEQKIKHYNGNKCITCGIPITYRSKLGFCRKHSLRKKKSLKEKSNLSLIHRGNKNSMFGKHSWNYGKKFPNKSGENNHSWKGEVTPLRKKIRNSFEYRQWRSDVFERDDYTCVMCNKKGGELNADHIKSFSSILEEYKLFTIQDAVKCQELWNINNGRTLCISCHKKTPNYGGKKVI